MSLRYLVYPVTVFGLIVSMTGCREKDKDSDDSKRELTPAEVDTWMTSAPVMENGIATFRYKSNVENARFKCQIESNGQPGEWQDCPPHGIQVNLDPSQSHRFKVKAVNAKGVEDPEPYVFDLPAAGPEMVNLSTRILNKEEVGQIYARDSLTLYFGVQGDQVRISDLSYECKRENDRDWHDCPDRDMYHFTGLTNGTYSLAVRAVHEDSGAVAVEDRINFRVKLGINVIGADELRSKREGLVHLAFENLLDNQHVMCSLNEAQFEDCSRGYAVDLGSDRFEPGVEYTLKIEARDQFGTVVYDDAIKFCSQTCPGLYGGDVAPLEIGPYLIGQELEFTIPQHMYVQQYASNFNPNSQNSFYRVLSHSDPYAIGNYRCEGEFDRVITALGPQNSRFDYCHSTLPRPVQDWLFEHRFSSNHLQAATLPQLIDQDPSAQDVILINTFDTHYEFQTTRSRFLDLCRNAIDGVRGKEPIRNTGPIALARDFWVAEYLAAEFWVCDTLLSSSGPNGFGQSQVWKVGAFMIVQKGHSFPDLRCNTCGYSNDSFVEVVYMTRGNFITDEHFIRAAQELFVYNLSKALP